MKRLCFEKLGIEREEGKCLKTEVGWSTPFLSSIKTQIFKKSLKIVLCAKRRRFFSFRPKWYKFCKSFGVGGAHNRKSSLGCAFSLKIPVQNLRRLITPITTLDTKILIALKVNGASSRFCRPCFPKVYNAQ